MFLLLLLAHFASAGNWEPPKQDQLKIDVGFVSPSFNFNLDGPGTAEAKFRPNTPSKLGVGFAYRNIGLGYSFANKPDPQSITDRGDSSSTDFQFRFTGKHSLDFVYQSYSGYYIENSAELDGTYATGDARIKKPDVRTVNYAIMYLYNFDPADFSLTASVSQTARQTSSGWGRFLFCGMNENDVADNSTLIPSANVASFGELGSLKTLKQKTLVVGGALGGTLSSGKFYVTMLVGIGAAAKSGTATYQGLEEKTLQGSGPAVISRFGFGYNGEYHVVALTGITDQTTMAFSGGAVNTQLTEARFQYSYRFDGINIPPLNWASSLLD